MPGRTDEPWARQLWPPRLAGERAPADDNPAMEQAVDDLRLEP